MTVHSSGHTVFSLTHMEGITLSAGEEADEVSWSALKILTGKPTGKRPLGRPRRR